MRDMVPARLLASRCIPHLTCPMQPASRCRSLLFSTLRRRASCRGFRAAADHDKGISAAADAAGESAAKDRRWGEKEFGSLQRKASSRLHRFYVPQPLGPKATTPSLDSLLTNAAASGGGASAAAPAAGPAAAAAPSGASAASAAGPPPSVVLEGEEARHAARALRLQSGDRVELCDGRGNLVAGVVSGSDRQRVWVTSDGPCAHVPWAGSRWVVAVACTTLKGGRAEWLVEKLTELGAYMMVPLVTERSQAGGKAKFRTRGSSSSRGAAAGDGGDGEPDGDYQPGRLERVAIAATKQSLRPHALHLAPPTPLAEVLPLVRAVSSGGAGQRVAPRKHARKAGSGTESGFGPGSGSGGVDDVGSGAGPGASHRPGVEGGRPPTAPGGRGFCLVAVAGAPSLAAVLRDVHGRESAAMEGTEGSGPAGSRDASAGSGGRWPGDGADLEPSTGDEAGAPDAPLRVLFIGPEGDFTPGELAALVEAGARPVGLGANRLRTETAAVGLLAACLLTE